MEQFTAGSCHGEEPTTFGPYCEGFQLLLPSQVIRFEYAFHGFDRRLGICTCSVGEANKGAAKLIQSLSLQITHGTALEHLEGVEVGCGRCLFALKDEQNAVAPAPLEQLAARDVEIVDRLIVRLRLIATEPVYDPDAG